ncbi:MAG: DNRLRE domain-containing protein [Calditrichaeota bacterium]|nr:MAG: DNRLRE domain-containing protein [Calditrichota bacterium]
MIKDLLVSYIWSNKPLVNYGDQIDFWAKKDDDKIAIIYLKFNVSEFRGELIKAIIRLKVIDGSPDGGTIFQTSNQFKNSSEPWNDKNLNFTNAPRIHPRPLSSLRNVQRGDTVEFDVTAAIVQPGIYSFCIKSNSADAVRFSSKEGEMAPLLIIESKETKSEKQLPIARAGKNQRFLDIGDDGFERVNLDGSNSFDPDGGKIISYQWMEGNKHLGEGPMISIDLEVGNHVITLIVTDDENTSASDQIIIVISSSILSFFPVEDAYVDSNTPQSNTGSSSELKVMKDNSQTVISYLKFNLKEFSGIVKKARLRLKVVNASDDGGMIFKAANNFKGKAQPWNEKELNFNNAPIITNSVLNSLGSVNVGDMVEFDVTKAISNPGIYSFAIFNNSTNSVRFSSKEGNKAPELILEFSVSENQPPVVDAGLFQLIELAITNSVQMGAVVVDDGLPDPPGTLEYQWSVILIDPVAPPTPFNKPDPNDLKKLVEFSPDPTVLNPTLTFFKDGLFILRLTVTDSEFVVEDETQVLVLRQGLVPVPLNRIPIPGPDNLQAFDLDQSLLIDGVSVPFSHFVVNKEAAIRLGKALFWDMQVGSDGVQACASCHFHAGADNRFINSLSPGMKGGDESFQLGGPNYTLTLKNFPFHKLSDPENRFAQVIADFNEVTSSMGVVKSLFKDIIPFNAVEDFVIQPDAAFNTGKFNTRRVEPRNTPTVINAVFNFRNFWDGRAFNNFNGVNPFGNRDPNARLVLDPDGPGGQTARQVSILIPLSSLASQAVGPPMSPFEMSADKRTWPKVGKKLLTLKPLAKQLVHTEDSILGDLSASPENGLLISYEEMIKTAFNPRWWNSNNVITFTENGIPVVNPPTLKPLSTDEYTLMEANFSLFFGLAVQAYEATLVSDETRFDRFRSGDSTALNLNEQRGMKIFTNIGLDPTVPAGFCVNCHVGPEFTAASVSIIGFQELITPFEPLRKPELIIERMPMAQGQGRATLDLVANKKLAPDPGASDLPLDFDPRGKLIEISDAGSGTLMFYGTLPGEPTSTLPPSHGPCGQVFYVIRLFPTEAIPDTISFADAAYRILPDCSEEFNVNIFGVVPGFYEVFADGIKRGTLEVTANAIYDLGFYNTGIRPIEEDPGIGATDDFGNPLSFSRMELLNSGREDIRKGVPGGGLGKGHEFNIPIGSLNDPPAVNGAFKVPGLRNVELTGPYFHNGGQATLQQVIDFYNRGGDFSDNNLSNLAPDILPLGLTKKDKNDLLAFLLALTDERVRNQSAPFDHPQLFVPNGHDPITGETLLLEIPAVGATGGPPIKPFLNLDQQKVTGNLIAVNSTKEDQKVLASTLPEKFSLEQNYPNPFNPTTIIRFALPDESHVRLEIYNILGQKVRTLVNEVMAGGVHAVEWDGLSDHGQSLVSGVYIYRLQTPKFIRAKKMLIVR